MTHLLGRTVCEAAIRALLKRGIEARQWRVRWAAATFSLLSLIACSPSESKDVASDVPMPPKSELPVTGTRPLRIVRVNDGDWRERWRGLQIAFGGCLIHLKLPDRPLPEIDMKVVAQSFRDGEEEMFDGNKQAKFGYSSALTVDVKQNCAIVLTTEWTAEVSVGCSQHWQGQSALVNHAIEDPDQASTEDIPNDVGANTCNLDYSPFKSAWLPKDAPPPIGKDVPVRMVDGVPCQLWSVHAARLLGDKVANGPVGLEHDFCVYARQPYYANQDKRLVMIQSTVASPEMEAQVLLPPEVRKFSSLGVGLPTSSRVEAFSEGAPISPERFTRKAVEQWVMQPTQKALAK